MKSTLGKITVNLTKEFNMINISLWPAKDLYYAHHLYRQKTDKIIQSPIADYNRLYAKFSSCIVMWRQVNVELNHRESKISDIPDYISS